MFSSVEFLVLAFRLIGDCHFQKDFVKQRMDVFVHHIVGRLDVQIIGNLLSASRSAAEFKKAVDCLCIICRNIKSIPIMKVKAIISLFIADLLSLFQNKSTDN